jgi:hypothetical protein
MARLAGFDARRARTGVRLQQADRGDNPFDPYRLRLFTDAQMEDHVQVLGQFVYDDASGIYVDGAYIIYTPWLDRDLRFSAGKLPWIVGTWAPRTYSNKNPLVSAPLMYQYHSTLLWYAVPPSADALHATAGTGQLGPDYFGFSFGPGMPVIDDSYWDVGINISGSQRPFEYAIGLSAGTPSWGSTQKDDNTGHSVLGRIGFAPFARVAPGRLGVLRPLPARQPRSRHATRQDRQRLRAAALHGGSRGAEWRTSSFVPKPCATRWMTPTVGDLDVEGGYAELKYLDVVRRLCRRPLRRRALRRDRELLRRRSHLGLETLTRVEGADRLPDRPRRHRKLVYQWTQQDNDNAGADDPEFSIVGAQISIGF